jgi:hypothetical protein
VIHWNGSSWQGLDAGTDTDLWAVWGSGAGDVHSVATVSSWLRAARWAPRVLSFGHMVAVRPLLARLLALALVVTAAPALAARAPQALRAWIDVAGEIAQAQAAALRHAPAQRRLRSVARQAFRARPSFARISIARAIRPAALESAASWPLARTGRELIDLKSARLI